MMPVLRRLPEEGRALAAETVAFLASRWKLLAALALAVFAVAMALVLLLPSQYEKKMSLTVTPRIGEVQQRLGQQKLPDREKTGRTALVRLQERSFGPVEVVSTYDDSAGEVRVLMRAYSRDALEEAARGLDESLDESFREDYEESLTTAIKNGIASAEAGLASNRTTLSQIDAALDYNREVGPSSPDPAAATAAIQNLETQRADLLAAVEQKEENLEFFENALEDPGAAADKAVEIAVSSDSEVARTGTYSSPVAAVAPLAIVAAVAMALRLTAGGGASGPRRRGETPVGNQGTAT